MNKYVQTAALDGRPLDRAWFFHDAVAAGKTLRLQLGATANESWATDPTVVPPSASNTGLDGFGCTAE